MTKKSAKPAKKSAKPAKKSAKPAKDDSLAPVLLLHNCVKLNAKESKASRADWQRRPSYDDNERYADTIVVDGADWTFVDSHREEHEGHGREALDEYLRGCDQDDEDDAAYDAECDAEGRDR